MTPLFSALSSFKFQWNTVQLEAEAVVEKALP